MEPLARPKAGGTQDPEPVSAEAERIWNSLEPELRPFVDRGTSPHFWRRHAVAARSAARWRGWRSDPLPSLSGDELLARTEDRLRGFWRGDHSPDDSQEGWPLSKAQRDAIRDAAGATSGPERLRAIADLLEVSPYFDWHASAEALRRQQALVERDGEYFRSFRIAAAQRIPQRAGIVDEIFHLLGAALAGHVVVRLRRDHVGVAEGALDEGREIRGRPRGRTGPWRRRACARGRPRRWRRPTRGSPGAGFAAPEPSAGPFNKLNPGRRSPDPTRAA